MSERAMAALAALLVAGPGCAVRIAELAAAVPAGVADAPGESLVTRGHAVGRSCRWAFFGVPFGLPQIDEAMRAALAERGGRALREVTVSSDHQLYGPLGRNCYTIRGEVLG